MHARPGSLGECADRTTRLRPAWWRPSTTSSWRHVIVGGLRTGGNRSPFHGYTTEFRQHRSYRAGDDLKHLDWKLYGRSDRLYTRQFRETTNLSVMLILDTSASMAFPSVGVSKFRYASIVAAALAYLISQEGNAVGLMSMTQGRWPTRPVVDASTSGPDRATRRPPPGGEWDGPVIPGVILQRRGVVIAL
ncbi:MAG: DUF58 domain-containing protein [Dehalococcoidia bacterium]|nr:DUF58 domain-containing protein [Dehalococcoidia bacterium]